MINPGHLILKAWYELLAGNISVPVYRTDAPAKNAPERYILLRIESSTDRRNNHSDVTMVVLITEVIARLDARINDEYIFQIDSEIGELLSSNPATHNLPAQAGIQITDVVRQNQTVLGEDDGVYRYNRLITRNIHRVAQLAEAS